ncbi:MAG: prepilin-type N-terminal cleavage/methylation domain-containing protein [Gemmatimonadota bacterium]|jgi:prepilin-type N-terminal cleavage/methylation domain-containing protein
MRSHRQDGFTLIELLIVVVIIGILAAIAIPKFTSARDKAFIASMKADLRNLATLQDLYHNGNYTYSSDATALEFVTSEGVTVNISPGATGQGWSASATHLGLPGAICAIYHGNAAQLTPATVESQIMCN